MSEVPPEGVPSELWNDALAAQAAGEVSAVEEAAQALLNWCDGRSAEQLAILLDALRVRQAYAISLEVLEAAWNSSLPLDGLGRIAEDWLGTVLHGIGDRSGAEEVAEHLAKGARKHGAAFAADLGHLMLEWSLRDAAESLIVYASESMPGDMTLRYDLGIIHKFKRRWAESKACFEHVLRHRPGEQAALWNLGIACTALQDWAGARAAWAALNINMPDGEGDFAAEGDVTPVRLPVPVDAEVDSEVVWGLRLCPARVRLKSIPRFSVLYGYEDVVLVDGVSEGDARYDGRDYPVFPALASWSGGSTQTFRLATTDSSAVLRLLQGEGWPAVNWSSLPGESDNVVGVAVPAGGDVSDLTTLLDRSVHCGQYQLTPLKVHAAPNGD